jgi:hypothetical protein
VKPDDAGKLALEPDARLEAVIASKPFKPTADEALGILGGLGILEPGKPQPQALAIFVYELTTGTKVDEKGPARQNAGLV